ncbi:MAG: bis(5'-nucleosyl)-tetraphosphatase [Patescibacteria group bacterium]
MKMEKSAGFVIYRKEKGEIKFLLLKYPSDGREVDYWGLPKGHIENKESVEEAALRELFEETGIKEKEIDVKEGFREVNKYYFKHEGDSIFKIVVYFLAQTKKETITVSHEHSDFKWANFDQAMKLIPFKNTKKIVKKAKEFI